MKSLRYVTLWRANEAFENQEADMSEKLKPIF